MLAIGNRLSVNQPAPPMVKASSDIDPFRFWARAQFAAYRGCVAFIETVDADGATGIGTGFHVGDGVFVTARHVVEGMQSIGVGFDDDAVTQQLMTRSFNDEFKIHGMFQSGRNYAEVKVIEGPLYHSDPTVDVACFKVAPHPTNFIPLGGHFNDYLHQYELVLYRTLVMGYPPIPLTMRPILVASVGEVNALTDLYVGCKHPHFVVSTVARGGFSGGPVLVAYNEYNPEGGTAALGLVTQSLTENDKAPEHGYMAVLTVEPIYSCLKENKMLPPCQSISPGD